jgi:multicomponent Na+:H+ antiporter subunit A
MFERMLNGLPRVAAWHTKALQHGSLAGYLRLTLIALLVLGFGGWLAGDADWPMLWSVLWSGYEQGWALLAAAVLISAGALAAPFLHDRLALLMAIGLVGYGSAVLFLFAGAPDVAFTQFMVETVLVVVAAAVLSRYGAPSRYPERRLLNAVIALAAGVGTFILLAHMFSLPADRSLAEWFAANSLPEAHGRNVVNVILVDFRAFDTFGEIAVVAFSALAAWPLLQKMRKHRGTS